METKPDNSSHDGTISGASDPSSHQKGRGFTHGLLTAQDIADRWGTNVKFVQRMARDNGLPVVRMGRKLRFIAENVEAWEEEQEVQRRLGLKPGMKIRCPHCGEVHRS